MSQGTCCLYSFLKGMRWNIIFTLFCPAAFYLSAFALAMLLKLYRFAGTMFEIMFLLFLFSQVISWNKVITWHITMNSFFRMYAFSNGIHRLFLQGHWAVICGLGMFILFCGTSLSVYLLEVIWSFSSARSF